MACPCAKPNAGAAAAGAPPGSYSDCCITRAHATFPCAPPTPPRVVWRDGLRGGAARVSCPSTLSKCRVELQNRSPYVLRKALSEKSAGDQETKYLAARWAANLRKAERCLHVRRVDRFTGREVPQPQQARGAVWLTQLGLRYLREALNTEDSGFGSLWAETALRPGRHCPTKGTTPFACTSNTMGPSGCPSPGGRLSARGKSLPNLPPKQNLEPPIGPGGPIALSFDQRAPEKPSSGR